MGIARFGLAIRGGITATHGDFFATLPGAYAEALNPTLWNSPDLADSWQFHERTYLHGPTQYLTLFPMVWLDSYRAIASALLPLYAIAVVAIAWAMVTLMTPFVRRVDTSALLLAATLSYFPLLYALICREFEVVITLATAWLCIFASREQQSAAGALAAYIAGFKYIQLLYLPYFAVQRWWKAVAGFAVGVVVIAGLTRVGLGPLDLLFNNNVPGIADKQWTSLFSTSALCAGWRAEPTTFAGVRWGLCGLYGHGLPIPPPLMFAFISMSCLAISLAAWLRIERRTLGVQARRWRRILEISIVATVSALFFHAHYYYLSVLIVPLGALLMFYLADSPLPRVRLTLWVAAYLLLSAGPLPMSVVTRVIGTDWYLAYLRYVLYLPGELLLIGLLLSEYWAVGSRGDSIAAA